MQHTLKSAVLAASLCLASGLVSGLSMAEIKLGVDTAPYPPFSQTSTTGELEGWEIEIGNAVCAANKLLADSMGNETPVKLNDWIDVGAFSDSGEERLMFVKRVKIDSRKMTFNF